MEKYLMQRNMVYQLMPVEVENQEGKPDGFRKNMDTDIQYDLLVDQKDKFTYGGIESGEITYIDPSGNGSLLTSKYLNYFELAKALNDERTYLQAQARQMMTDTVNEEYDEVGKQLMQESEDKKAKVKTVLDLMLQLFPHKVLPYDNNMVNVAQVYQQIGENEKALEILNTMMPQTMDELEYFYFMSRESVLTASMFENDQLRSETAVYYAIELAKKAGDETYADALNNQWEALRLKYAILAPNERRGK